MNDARPVVALACTQGGFGTHIRQRCLNTSCIHNCRILAARQRRGTALQHPVRAGRGSWFSYGHRQPTAIQQELHQLACVPRVARLLLPPYSMKLQVPLYETLLHTHEDESSMSQVFFRNSYAQGGEAMSRSQKHARSPHRRARSSTGLQRIRSPMQCLAIFHANDILPPSALPFRRIPHASGTRGHTP
jgi:hypothetical protein